MDEKGEGKAGKDGLDAVYVRVGSLGDLARLALGSHSHIRSVRHGKSHRLMLDGEEVGPTIVYYFDSDRPGRYLLYTPDSDGVERAAMSETAPSGLGDDYRSMRFPILELSMDPKSESTRIKKVTCVGVEDMDSVIRALVSSAGEEDYIPKVYAFAYKGTMYIGTMELFGRKERVFVYSRCPDKASPAYRYDYIKDTIEQAKSVSNGGTYVRVINLAEPFPFFKP